MSRPPRHGPPGWAPPPISGAMPPGFIPPSFIPPPSGFPIPGPFVPPPMYGAYPPQPGGIWPGPIPGGLPTGFPVASNILVQPNPAPVPSKPVSKPEGSENNKEEPESSWSEHTTETGQPYWYNKVTKISVWEKPEALKTEIEKEEQTKWQEYLTDEGTKYYYNSETDATQWEIPQDYKAYLERVEAKKKKVIETPIEKLLKSVFPDDLSKQRFARCLVERGMLSNWTFDQCLNATFEDKRSKQLKMAERKQVFQALGPKLRTHEIDEKRRKERQLEDDFFAMLNTWKEFDRYTTWRELLDKFGEDPRFLAVSTERECSKLFSDFQAAHDRKLHNESRQALQKSIKALQDLIEKSGISVSTTWKEFKEKYESEKAFQDLEPLDRLQAFADYIRYLERKEDEELSLERRKIRAVGRKARESFRKLLQEKYVIGAFSFNSRWATFFPMILSDPRYTEMLKVTGSTPTELFYDFLLDLEDKYLKEKKKVKTIAKSLSLRVLRIHPAHALPENSTMQYLPIPPNIMSMTLKEVPKIDFVTWQAAIKPQLPPHFDESILQQIYIDFAQRELDKTQRRIKRSERHFVEYLEDHLPNADCTWNEIKPKVDSTGEFDTIPEINQELIFNTLIQDWKLHKKSRSSIDTRTVQREGEIEEGEVPATGDDSLVQPSPSRKRARSSNPSSPNADAIDDGETSRKLRKLEEDASPLQN